jgi:hypothetical protein
MTKKSPLPPGTPAPISSIYNMMGPRGGVVKEVLSEKGEPLPPTPRAGMGYVPIRPVKNKSGKR